MSLLIASGFVTVRSCTPARWTLLRPSPDTLVPSAVCPNTLNGLTPQTCAP